MLPSNKQGKFDTDGWGSRRGMEIETSRRECGLKSENAVLGVDVRGCVGSTLRLRLRADRLGALSVPEEVGSSEKSCSSSGGSP